MVYTECFKQLFVELVKTRSILIQFGLFVTFGAWRWPFGLNSFMLEASILKFMSFYVRFSDFFPELDYTENECCAHDLFPVSKFHDTWEIHSHEHVLIVRPYHWFILLLFNQFEGIYKNTMRSMVLSRIAVRALPCRIRFTFCQITFCLDLKWLV